MTHIYYKVVYTPNEGATTNNYGKKTGQTPTGRTRLSLYKERKVHEMASPTRKTNVRTGYNWIGKSITAQITTHHTVP